MNITRDQCIKWIEALRSGEYQQGIMRLKFVDKQGNKEFCCLGVARELFNIPVNTTNQEGSTLDYNWLSRYHQEVLVNYNDGTVPFDEEPFKNFHFIANYLEETLLPLLTK